ncbi:MAG: NAD-dependent epimerase/dehydratase family protein [Chitinophagales bacterium]|nr:NAD-dependent epimerase/dehydratase family protein [Bacteroidota bacterium]MBK8682845.1 NAD-dependent epimerase/dehydratase family protein [Bacteroidota bacterium]
MKVFVTGATGLIGNHLVKELLANGDEVKVFVRKTSNLEILSGYNVEFAFGDINSEEELTKAAKGCALIYHTAGVFAYWGYDEKTFIAEAKQSMENVIHAAAINHISRVVFTSSSVTLGASDTKEILSENKSGNFNDAPAYIKAKVIQENSAFETGKKNNVEVIAICPTITIGAPDFHLTESNRMIVNFLKDPYKATWIGGCNIVSARDIAKAMILLAHNGKSGEIYIAGSENMEWKEIHSMISELCGMSGPYFEVLHTSAYLLSAMHEFLYHFTNTRPTSTREQAKMVGKYYWYSSDKLKQLGYSPQSAEDAFIETISWLVTSEHIPASLRASIKLSEKIYAYRNKNISE